jgi:uncharacterized protein (TIGR00251 family)
LIIVPQTKSLYLGLPNLLFLNHDLVFHCVVCHSQEKGDLTFAVHVAPRASLSEIVGEHDGALRVRLAAAPVEGAANQELIRLLAKSLKLPQNAFEIVSGIRSRRKIVRVHGGTIAQIERLMATK